MTAGPFEVNQDNDSVIQPPAEPKKEAPAKK
jgi:hypothetical protein